MNSTFKKRMEGGEYAAFTDGGNTITYSLLEASGEKEPIPAKDSVAQYKVKENKLTYKNVFPNIDLRNLTFDQNVKKDLVLNSYEGYYVFKFKLKTDLTANTNEDGSIDFLNKENEKIFNLPKPFMADSNLNELS